jgi:hypothetical protein
MTTDWFTEKTVSTWRELYGQLETYLKPPAHWVFRGQSNVGWKLQTQIERVRKPFRVNQRKLPDYEWKLVREFRRRAHIYHPSPPQKDDHLDWLALMRHHGGPTRLLDFTYSPFIATYFALESADKDSAVWAINYVWLRDQALKIVTGGKGANGKVYENFRDKRDGASFKTIFWSTPLLRFVSGANPMRLNERLTLQQGTFLCPGDITVSFETNLRAAAKVKDNVHKIVIKKPCRTNALARLRKMSIDSTTLFPGLDGFARSLNTRFIEIGEMDIVGDRYTF